MILRQTNMIVVACMSIAVGKYFSKQSLGILVLICLLMVLFLQLADSHSDSKGSFWLAIGVGIVRMMGTCGAAVYQEWIYQDLDQVVLFTDAGLWLFPCQIAVGAVMAYGAKDRILARGGFTAGLEHFNYAWGALLFSCFANIGTSLSIKYINAVAKALCMAGATLCVYGIQTTTGVPLRPEACVLMLLIVVLIFCYRRSRAAEFEQAGGGG